MSIYKAFINAIGVELVKALPEILSTLKERFKRFKVIQKGLRLSASRDNPTANTIDDLEAALETTKDRLEALIESVKRMEKGQIEMMMVVKGRVRVAIVLSAVALLGFLAVLLKLYV